MHDAFTLKAVLERVPVKIECIHMYGQKLFIGASNGSLLVYEIRETEDSSDIKVTLLSSLKSFSRECIEQIEYLNELGILLCLSDGNVSLHDGSDYSLLTNLTVGLGANVFATHRSVEMIHDIPNLMTRLCIATKKKLLFFEWKDSEFIAMKELLINDKVKAMNWVNGNAMCIGFAKDYVMLDVTSGHLTELFPTTKMKPIITRLSEDLLLAKDNVSVFVGFDGSTSRKIGITWTDSPEATVYVAPFIIALLPDCIEIRNPETQSLVQSFPLRRLRHITESKIVYVANGNSVWRLHLIPILTQIAQLVDIEEYNEGISMLLAIQTIPADEKEKKLLAIRTIFAYSLFNHKKFEQSMKLFTELDVDAIHVVALFPSLLTPEIQAQLDYPIPIASPDSNSITPALSALIAYLTDQRQKLSKTASNEIILRRENSSDLHISLDNVKQIVDTSLLKAYLATNESLVGPLVRVPNSCNIEEAEQLLIEFKRFQELIDFYFTKGLHSKALALLKRFGALRSGVLSGLNPTISYLLRLSSEHLSLILEYSTWILETNAAEGLKIFIRDVDEGDLAPRSKILAHLESINSTISLQYLEHLIFERSDATPDFHNKLILAYLSLIKPLLTQEHALATQTIAKDQGQLREYRKKLASFLSQDTHYKPEKVFSHFPLDDLNEERTILLGRMGRHDQALNIFVHKLKDLEGAERYCAEYSKADCYFLLFKILMKPLHAHDAPQMHQAISMLNRYSHHIDPLSVIDLIPIEQPLESLSYYWIDTLVDWSRSDNNNAIVKALLKAERLDVNSIHSTLLSKRVCIDDESSCDICNKRIGNSVFAYYSEANRIVHFVCKQKLEPLK